MSGTADLTNLTAYTTIVAGFLGVWLLYSTALVICGVKSPVGRFRKRFDFFSLLSSWRLYGGDGPRGYYVLETREYAEAPWEMAVSAELPWRPWYWLWHPHIIRHGVIHRHAARIAELVENQFAPEVIAKIPAVKFFDRYRPNDSTGQWRVVRREISGDQQEEILIYTSSIAP